MLFVDGLGSDRQLLLAYISTRRRMTCLFDAAPIEAYLIKLRQPISCYCTCSISIRQHTSAYVRILIKLRQPITIVPAHTHNLSQHVRLHLAARQLSQFERQHDFAGRVHEIGKCTR